MSSLRAPKVRKSKYVAYLLFWLKGTLKSRHVTAVN